MRLLLGLGAAAGAILSIAGVVGLLSPKEPPSPRGTFESVTADPGQGITEFSARLKTASMDTGRVDAVPAVYAATARVVRAAQLASDPAEPGSTAPSGPDSTGSGTTPEATPESTDPQTTPSEPPPPTATENEQQQQPDGLENQALPGSFKPVVQRPPGGAAPAPGYAIPKEDCEQVMSWAVNCPSAKATHDPVVAATNLVRVFRNTRTQPVPEAGKTEPVGAAVNFNLTLENLEGRNVVVRWSMYRVGAGSPLPHNWLVNRRVYREHVDRSSETVSKEFWVPLPRRRGPYFVRLSAWDGNNRLDYEDSKPAFP
jgi:hypothetical protein